jgi:adenylyltransferase/sulfurtransferase
MAETISRYSRHELLRMIGPDGQERIKRSRVLVAGVGALGSLIAALLVRAGVGFLRIVDQDRPEIHNLHRQLLYEEADVKSGLSKVEAAAVRLRSANSEVAIEAVTAAVAEDTVEALTEGVGLVVDGLDNIRARYFMNDIVLLRRIPYVFGGAVEAAGNVMTIIPGRTACLRCLWPESESVQAHPTAASVGVLSAAATAVASMEVAEALKILAGREDETLSGLLVMDVWRGSFQVAQVSADPSCVCRRIV